MVDAYVEGLEPMMEHYGIGAHAFALLWGFLFGILFIGINGYVFRIFLGFALSVLVYAAFISSVAHAGFYVSYYVAFLMFLGTVCASTVKPLWRRAVMWMRQDGQ